MSLKGFNLIQDATAPPDAWDKVYEWVSKVGRIIVMLVEVVVIASFVSRIIIDTQTKNLTKQDQALTQAIQASNVNEQRFREYQDKFTDYKVLWNQATSNYPVLIEVTKLIPASMSDVAIGMGQSAITITGSAPLADVNNLETTLKKSNMFSRVLVPEIVSKGATSGSGVDLDFSIRIDVKPELLKARKQIGQS